MASIATGKSEARTNLAKPVGYRPQREGGQPRSTWHVKLFIPPGFALPGFQCFSTGLRAVQYRDGLTSL